MAVWDRLENLQMLIVVVLLIVAKSMYRKQMVILAGRETLFQPLGAILKSASRFFGCFSDLLGRTWIFMEAPGPWSAAQPDRWGSSSPELSS